MTKKHFIALADAIREHNRIAQNTGRTNDIFSTDHLETLCYFCRSQNSNFNANRWLAYLAGECGPSGGSIKKEKALAQ